MQNRREFVGHLVGGVAVAGLGLTLEGCNALSDLETWVPVGLAAFDGIIGIVDGPLVAIGTTVDGLWAAVSNAINLYNHSTDPQVTRLDKVIATLDALAGGLTQVLAALPLTIPTVVLNAAKLGLGLLIATLKAIRDKLQPVTPAPMAVYTVPSGVPPAKNGKDFVNKFNKIMSDNGQTFRVK